MKLTFGLSPCPNDTFIFDALINKKIDTGELNFEPVFEDVQTLNQWALSGKLSFTKLSYGVLPLVLHDYVVLNSGSAIGMGVGPLLIANKNLPGLQVEDYLIALPGKNTTAHLLFSMAYPLAKNKIFLRYDEIENFVVEEKGLGVIIHENRFTYQQKGLYKINDLGNYWEEHIKGPIPLGGIVANRKLDINLIHKVDKLINESLQYAFNNDYKALSDFVKKNAQEMDESVMRQHIELYVNEFSLDLGKTGRHAILELLNVYNKINPQDKLHEEGVFADI